MRWGWLSGRPLWKAAHLLRQSVLYGLTTLAAAFAPNIAVLLLLRLLAGIGVGAEYSAINAAISEFVPSRSRGQAVALVLNFSASLVCQCIYIRIR
jgi:MFS family permease